MQFPTNWTELNETLLKVPQQKLAKAICALLIIYVAFLAAKITWLLLDSDKPVNTINSMPAQQTTTEKAKINLSALKKLNLFGEYNKTEEAPKVEIEQAEDAPETKLNLTLTGAVASNDNSIAAAVIESNGKQATYGINEQITGTRASLAKVFHDRVLIKVNGRHETLMLDGFRYQKNSNKTPSVTKSTRKGTNNKQSSFTSPKVVDQRNNKRLNQSAKKLKEDLSADPGKITDHLRISPKRQGGNIIGYSLMPGKNGEFFSASGLKSGDVAIQINGYDLTEPRNAAQALQELKEQSEVSLVVDRNGDITEILFSIN